MKIKILVFCVFMVCFVVGSLRVFGYAEKPIQLMGVSTAAYQIEGAWNEDGKGVSVWDHFTHTRKMENGDVACDDYHRVLETVQLLKDLGVNVYRFSVAWTRIQPEGVGQPNPKGIAYYRLLISELKKAGIAPMVTLYHWDLPQTLEEKGGWTNRETVYRYVDYAKLLFREFGSDVNYWITHNEPRVVASFGYGTSKMAPGLNNPAIVTQVIHHLLLSHGLAVKAYREMGLAGKIGISLNLKPVYLREGGDPAEVQRSDEVKNRYYLDPLLLGTYPKSFGHPSFIEKGDMAVLSTPIDFLGVNYYSPQVVPASKHFSKEKNSLGWEVYPDGLYDLLKRLAKDYHVPPIIITENGYADEMTSEKELCLLDSERIQYIQTHFNAVKRAKNEGVPVIGYVVWSLLDNLEWSFGYKPRFGLVHVDYRTLKRTPKASFQAYRKLIQANGLR